MRTRRAGSSVLGAVSAAAMCATLTGCGLDGHSPRFEPEGFGITFDYPTALTEKNLRGGGSPESDDVVRELTLTDDDFIAVRRDPVDPRLLAGGTNALRPEMDQLAGVLDPRVSPGHPITIGGMPGLEYDDAAPGTQHRFLFFLRRDAMYLVHCESTDAHRDEITAACDTVQRTLHSV